MFYMLERNKCNDNFKKPMFFLREHHKGGLSFAFVMEMMVARRVVYCPIIDKTMGRELLFQATLIPVALIALSSGCDPKLPQRNYTL